MKFFKKSARVELLAIPVGKADGSTLFRLEMTLEIETYLPLYITDGKGDRDMNRLEVQLKKMIEEEVKIISLKRIVLKRTCRRVVMQFFCEYLEENKLIDTIGKILSIYKTFKNLHQKKRKSEILNHTNIFNKSRSVYTGTRFLYF